MGKIKKHEAQLKFYGLGETDVEKTSISVILNMLTTAFDSNAAAQNTFNANYENENSVYYHKTISEILEIWEERANKSRYYGRKNDEYIGAVLEGEEYDVDLYYLDNDVESDERLKIQVESFDEYINDLPDNIEFVCREQPVRYSINETNQVMGRFDALFYDTDRNKWIIVDWKTSNIETTKTRWTENFLGPAKEFPALNWYSYTIQLYYYKIALIENGYLPEGTTYDDVEVQIVSFPGKRFEDTGKLYKILEPAFVFDKDKLDGIFTFGIKKNILLNKKNGSDN